MICRVLRDHKRKNDRKKTESDAKKANPYDQMGVKEIKDSEGNTVTLYSTGRSIKKDIRANEDEQMEKEWKIMQHMIMDNRG